MQETYKIQNIFQLIEWLKDTLSNPTEYRLVSDMDRFRIIRVLLLYAQHVRDTINGEFKREETLSIIHHFAMDVTAVLFSDIRLKSMIHMLESHVKTDRKIHKS